MGFDFTGLIAIWLDKNNNFLGSIQKKNSGADTGNPDYYKALREEIKLGKLLLRSDLKVIRVRG